MKFKYKGLKERFARLAEQSALDKKVIRATFEAACDGWRPGDRVEAGLLLDLLDRRRPTWLPLRQALGAWIGLSASEFKARVVDKRLRRRVPFGMLRPRRNWEGFHRGEIAPTE